MIKQIINLFFQVILSFFGWNDIASHYYNILKSTPKAVVIYPHSSYFDYVFFVLYNLGYNLDDFYTIMTERFSFIRFSNIIYAPDVYLRSYMDKGYSFYSSFFLSWKDILLKGKYNTLNNKKQNFVKSVCDTVRNKDKFKILISPTGSTSKRNWRSGFFYIAKELNIPIIIAGIDYKNKTIVVNGKFNNLTDYDTCKRVASPLVDTIPSFHNTKDLSVISWSKTIKNIIKIYIIYKLVSW